jgi:branched-subunit amino acid transport protein
MSSTITIWLAIVLGGLITLLFRASFIVFADASKFPDWFRRALSFVPPAVIAALIVPGLVLPPGAQHLSLTHPRLAAGLIALLVAWRTRNAMLTIAVGMGALWAIQWAVA